MAAASQATASGVRCVTNSPYLRLFVRKRVLQTGAMLPAVEPQRPAFSLAGAGSVLIGLTAACCVVGALIGWAVGKLGLGLALGAVVGVPVGVAATVIKYHDV